MHYSPEYIEINGSKFELKYSYDYLQSIVEKIADRINEDYKDKEILFIVVLKGAVQFAVDLLKHISCECSVEFITASSYLEAMKSQGKVKIGNLTCDVKDKNVIIIEDILESGRTLQAICRMLNLMHPRSLEIATLFFKPDNLLVDIKAKYIGIEIPSDFIVGYGLDYAQKGRQYANVYQLCK